MTDVKRLLDEATPLPWMWLIDTHEPPRVFLTNDPKDEQEPIVEGIREPDAALIEYAVNRLPDYEAAVDALERLFAQASELELGFIEAAGPTAEWARIFRADVMNDARAALRRLRGDR